MKCDVKATDLEKRTTFALTNNLDIPGRPDDGILGLCKNNKRIVPSLFRIELFHMKNIFY